MLTLVLASQSPRRRELLEKAGFRFHTSSMEISEIIDENLSLDDALMDLARQKASAVIQSNKLPKTKEFLVLSADTIVLLDGEILGKPKDHQDAMEKLSRLSGRTHVVKTAICLTHVKDFGSSLAKVECGVESSKVTFRKLTPVEIDEYIKKAKPFDKAGAYGVQDTPPGFIQEIEGNIDNVMGLPMKLVEEMLVKNEWIIDRKGPGKT